MSLAAGSRLGPYEIDLVAHSPSFIYQDWKTYYIKDSSKGPIVWEAKSAIFYYSSEGMPSRPHLLMVARNALDPSEVKYFVSNAPLNTPETQLLAVGFRPRWSGASRMTRARWGWTTSRCATTRR